MPLPEDPHRARLRVRADSAEAMPAVNDTAMDHLQRAADLLREATGEVWIASFRVPKLWRAEVLGWHKQLLSLSAELVKALAALV